MKKTKKLRAFRMNPNINSFKEVYKINPSLKVLSTKQTNDSSLVKPNFLRSSDNEDSEAFLISNE